MSNPTDQTTQWVYGHTFGRYSEAEFEAFVAPLATRLQKAGIGQDAFAGKRVLDAGCGGGRASVLMARQGAALVAATDFAPQNILTVTGHARRLGLGAIAPVRASLLALPYPDESFDVVWCNGVAHHTQNPQQALGEILRVLKVGGWLWLYLYGSGGLYWRWVAFVRGWLGDLTPQTVTDTLLALGWPAPKVAEFVDDWCVPVLCRYTHADVAAALARLGVAETPRLMGGVAYDSSQRLLQHATGEETAWMGEGDLRYFAQKTVRPQPGPGAALPFHGGEGSLYEDAPCVQEAAGWMDDLRQRVAARAPGENPRARVQAAANGQHALRQKLGEPAALDKTWVRDWLAGL